MPPLLSVTYGSPFKLQLQIRSLNQQMNCFLKNSKFDFHFADDNFNGLHLHFVFCLAPLRSWNAVKKLSFLHTHIFLYFCAKETAFLGILETCACKDQVSLLSFPTSHCLKITQNVAIEFLNFGIFHQFLSY